MKRLAGVTGILAPFLASLLVLVAGLATPGYDPASRTISRLAEPGLPAAALVELAICLVGAALLGLAMTLGPRALAPRLLRSGRGILS